MRVFTVCTTQSYQCTCFYYSKHSFCISHRFLGNLLQTAEGGWIGLNDRDVESTFVWNFDKKTTPAYLSWSESEPNNYNSKCNIENCVMMSRQNGGWSDIICNAFYSSVCESAMRNGKSTNFCIYIFMGSINQFLYLGFHGGSWGTRPLLFFSK